MAAKKMRRKVHKKIDVAPDLEVHVSTVRVATQTLTEIRNYIPSTKEYGRGVTFPSRVMDEISHGLIAAAREPQ